MNCQCPSMISQHDQVMVNGSAIHLIFPTSVFIYNIRGIIVAYLVAESALV